jgi:hypothetical protein
VPVDTVTWFPPASSSRSQTRQTLPESGSGQATYPRDVMLVNQSALAVGNLHCERVHNRPSRNLRWPNYLNVIFLPSWADQPGP